MQIVIKANSAQKSAFLQMSLPETVNLIWYEKDLYQEADAYFDCCFEEEGWAFNHIQTQPVFVNAVLVNANNLPKNAIRFNAWEGFLTRPVWEIALKDTAIKTAAELILTQMQQSFVWVPDQPGFIAARVIAMIINEAYFAFGEGISTQESIDTAMKLGTNYPFGPFEWTERIGIVKILTLLNELKKSNDRYQPAPFLIKSAALIAPTFSNTVTNNSL